jgi:hypothetical protein
VSEQEVVEGLVSKWVSLALEYASGAPDVRALYIYAASENPGASYVNVVFDQSGALVYPTDLAGVDNSIARASQVQDIFLDDLFAAEPDFEALGVPAPTEYRVYYEPSTRKLDTQLSRETIYGDSDKTPSFDGFEMWLGARAPKLY